MSQTIVNRLELDVEPAVEQIAEAMRSHVAQHLRRRGVVVGISGGIDSSACAALAVRAFGPERVLAIMMPERESGPESLELGKLLADRLGLSPIVEDITSALEGCGAYSRRDDAIRRIVPQYGDGWKCKVVLPHNRLGSDRLNVSSLVVQSPEGTQETVRLPSDVYREIVAATNFKQRMRKTMEYFHADRLHFAVLGTPNRLEYDQGFFVKGGDGLADVKPIAHLYKSQVYQIAAHLGVPEEIIGRPPTTDTYSLAQTQEEFYFSVSARTLDEILYAYNAGWSPEETAAELGYEVEAVTRAYRDIEQKRATTAYLHESPLLVEPVRLG